MSIKDEIARGLNELDAIILTLFNSEKGAPIRDGLFFQKEMFITINFIKEMKDDLDFIPHAYGPYSEPAEISLKNLVSLGLIEKGYYGFKISKVGSEILEIIPLEISQNKKEAIEDFKGFLNDLTKDELLVFTYFSYPDMTCESAVFEGVKKKRVSASVSLYNKRKVSLEKASFLAGLSMEDFIKIARGDK
jgi:predicted HTH domain antitoxin